MSAKLREKIALIVFSVLIVLSVGALTWYLSVGKNWNFAVARIDDATGQMEEYIAILFDGTVPPQSEVSSKNKDAESTNNSAEKAEDGLIAEDPDNRGRLTPKPAVTLWSAEKYYADKGAESFVIDVHDLNRYREGLIIKKGWQRFGVFSVSPLDTQVSLKAKVTYFKNHEVNFIVAVTNNPTLVKKVSGIDVVLYTENKTASATGEMIDGTYYVNTPQINTVGVILISPHNVVSAKTLQEL